MSVSGISSSGLFGFNTQVTQTKRQQFPQGFQQLGQDLQSGNLSAAQSDFAGLEQLTPQLVRLRLRRATVPSPRRSSSFRRIFSRATFRRPGRTSRRFRRTYKVKRRTGTIIIRGGSGPSAISQLLDQVGQALQSGNLSSAQPAYTALQQDFQQFAPTSALLTASTQSSWSGLNKRLAIADGRSGT